MTISKRVKSPKYDQRVWLSPSVGLTRQAHPHVRIVVSGGGYWLSILVTGRPSCDFWNVVLSILKKNVGPLTLDSTTAVVPDASQRMLWSPTTIKYCARSYGYHSLLLFWNQFGKNMYDATNSCRWVKRFQTNLYDKKKSPVFANYIGGRKKTSRRGGFWRNRHDRHTFTIIGLYIIFVYTWLTTTKKANMTI